ncbi:type IV toxin-antitoxin system AbiEi family antitoxin domain-containing protein [Demequina maris]|uniref:type IV toxin-antitoxin system AbiEi family antitoxin domain-containing protein n=1 Tax=Demequina maris TaxID=1638982 RepID=UPI0007856627|nr:hypothetical protein [Demequina maris]
MNPLEPGARLGAARERWRQLLGGRAGAVPSTLPLFTTAETGRAVRRHAAWLAHQIGAGTIAVVGRGLYVVVPDGAPVGWTPDPVEVAWLLAAHRFGRVLPYVCGVSAAALHGACAVPFGEVHVTVPRQTRDRPLPPLGATARFHQRREIDVAPGFWAAPAPVRESPGPVLETRHGELCDLRVTSRVQTALDLVHSPVRMGAPGDAPRLADVLVRGTDGRDVRTVATGQRRHKAWERLWRLRA